MSYLNPRNQPLTIEQQLSLLKDSPLELKICEQEVLTILQENIQAGSLSEKAQEAIANRTRKEPKTYDIRLKVLQSELDNGKEAIEELELIRTTLLVNYKWLTNDSKTIDLLNKVLSFLSIDLNTPGESK